MLAQTKSGAIIGIEGVPIYVEADFSGGLPSFNIVGLPDTSVREAKERVLAAVKNSGFEMPPRKVVLNLAPADIKKEGAVFDLAIAVSILQGTEQVSCENLEDFILLGELSLSGELRPVCGALPLVAGAVKAGTAKFIVPAQNAREAALVEGAQVFGAKTLNEALGHLTGKAPLPQTQGNAAALFAAPQSGEALDFSQVMGQESVKRAIEIAAAGGHNLLMVGSPGSGKTMLAQRIPTILPPLTLAEALETTKIHSVSGLLDEEHPLVCSRPFRAPHHSITTVGLVGGGSNPRPGELSLAHNGVLFLDEFAEFQKSALETMRQPLEDGKVSIARIAATHTFPCQTMLVAALNPCPCGWHGDKNGKCRCTSAAISRYMGKISGPLLDRMDVQVEAPSVEYASLTAAPGRTSAQMRESVAAARAVQAARGVLNARMTGEDLAKHCRLGNLESALMEEVFQKMGLTARGYTRILKVARTIADMEQSEQIDMLHLSEAISYRGLDAKFWQ